MMNRQASAISLQHECQSRVVDHLKRGIGVVFHLPVMIVSVGSSILLSVTRWNWKNHIFDSRQNTRNTWLCQNVHVNVILPLSCVDKMARIQAPRPELILHG